MSKLASLTDTFRDNLAVWASKVVVKGCWSISSIYISQTMVDALAPKPIRSK